MKIVIVGMGVQGKKRRAVAGADVAATVDPFVPHADFRTIEEVPLGDYEAALVCTPDQQKVALLRYLLAHKKHVLVEKPLIAEDGRDIQDLQALADSAGVACWTAYNHRFEPNLIRLQGVLAAGELGEIYHVRFFYGNGTAADVRQSPWRDCGMGVIPDLGSHLLDLTDFLLGVRPANLEPWGRHRFENQAFDHVVLGSHSRPALQYEMTLLSWRNSFAVDVIAEKGSAHVDCLCKWGPSTLTIRRRILPSGRPTEEAQVVTCPDPTWQAEYRAFLEMCERPRTSLEKDLWINTMFQQLQGQRKDVAWAA